MNNEQLRKILEQCKNWLNGRKTSKSTDLRNAHLIGANLRGAVLPSVDLNQHKVGGVETFLKGL